jgi:hypothetical protein
MNAEILAGELYLSPRPATDHASAAVDRAVFDDA